MKTVLIVFDRCARHLIIYGVTWPQRVRTPDSRDSESRESTPYDIVSKISRKSLSAVDRKLKAARLAQLKLERDKEMERQAEKVRLAEEKRKEGLAARKERKILEEMILTCRTKRAPKVALAQSKIEVLRKIEEAAGLSRDSSTSPERKRPTNPVTTASNEVGRARKRIKLEGADDRHHLASPQVSKGHSIPGEVEVISRGRQTSRTLRSTTEGVSLSQDTREERSRSPGRAPMDENGDDRRDKTFELANPHPPGQNVKRTGLLALPPNPCFVSRFRHSSSHPVRTDSSTPSLVEDESDETGTSDGNPCTPQNLDHLASTPDFVNQELTHGNADMLEPSPELGGRDGSDDAEGGENKLKVSTLKGLGLISKPSPIVLSKQVWSPRVALADGCTDDDDGVQIISRSPITPRRTQSNSSTVETLEVSPDIASKSSKTSACASPESDISISNYRVSVKRGRFDDLDNSSDEEDIIAPHQVNSMTFRLKPVTLSPITHSSTSAASCSSFTATTSAIVSAVAAATTPQTPKPASARSPITPITSPLSQSNTTPKATVSTSVLTSSPSLAKILNPPTVGPYRSTFFPASPETLTSPCLVKAGWESDA